MLVTVFMVAFLVGIPIGTLSFYLTLTGVFTQILSFVDIKEGTIMANSLWLVSGAIGASKRLSFHKAVASTANRFESWPPRHWALRGLVYIAKARPVLDFELFIGYASFGGEADEDKIFKGSNLYAEKVVVGNSTKTWQRQPHGYAIPRRENRYDPLLERATGRDVEKHREANWRRTRITSAELPGGPRARFYSAAILIIARIAQHIVRHPQRTDCFL